MTSPRPLIGFIGQGWVGRNYADDFEQRGYTVVRYSYEEPYIQNKLKIKECDIVFIAVPTPTSEQKFDDSIVRAVLPLVGKNKIAVIKSTLIPNTTKKIQETFPDIYLMHSPEFLSVVTARHDAAHPMRNIIGIPRDSEEYKIKAELVMSTLPDAPFKIVCGSTEAEIIKYGRNVLGYLSVVATNIFYDFTKSLEADWEDVKTAMSADEFNGSRYMTVIDQKGRGAGGTCFIKDFAAFKNLYSDAVQDELGKKMLEAVEAKNIELLQSTHKDLDLLQSVYGKLQ